MGLSSKSKRIKKNRAARRVTYYPKELRRLKATLDFKWDEKTKRAHLSMFHDMMNGPPPAVPGLEPGSGIDRLHLTETNVSADRNESLLKKRMETAVTSATRALDKQLVKAKEEKKMETDAEVKKIYDDKSMKDQFGRYASWLGQKAIKKLIETEREEKRRHKMRQRGIDRRIAMKKKNRRKSIISGNAVMSGIKDTKA